MIMVAAFVTAAAVVLARAQCAELGQQRGTRRQARPTVVTGAPVDARIDLSISPSRRPPFARNRRASSTTRADESNDQDACAAMWWEDAGVSGRVTSSVLIGRARERARLDAASRSAFACAPMTVLVAGEAGIGKTRLVAEFARDVATEALVLAGACIDERVPYLPITDALRSLVRSGWEQPGHAAGWGALAALAARVGRRREQRRTTSRRRTRTAARRLSPTAGELVSRAPGDVRRGGSALVRRFDSEPPDVHDPSGARRPAPARRHVPHRRPHASPPPPPVPCRGNAAAVH